MAWPPNPNQRTPARESLGIGRAVYSSSISGLVTGRPSLDVMGHNLCNASRDPCQSSHRPSPTTSNGALVWHPDRGEQLSLAKAWAAAYAAITAPQETNRQSGNRNE